ncbi:hypothetical protein COCCADRAFT_25367 [Bipolaris zeicola 26-R-13]|uniref:Uncharacterized protein n=1 Tax=Cochliobolus carbonum (strain 26-R-13) TaxID=930089 RepID=W6YSJ3_COCC2|nr:uncharacterized protein COCCADRAFT_25367 [Bipolaris zeicola 26-R-13]EUC34486.1 hypothetical protein COCCADRAFT_25367 [Bipolaris zeicola 26-R-13]
MILGQKAPFSSCDNIPAQSLSSAHRYKDSGHPSWSWLPGHSPEYELTPTANRFSILADPGNSSAYSPWHSNASTSNANFRRRRKRAGKRHKVQRKSAGIVRLPTTESIVALGHEISTLCLEDKSFATEDPRGLNQSRCLPDVTTSRCFAINGSDWPPQLQSDTLPTPIQFTNPPPPSVKSCASVETTLASSFEPSSVPQKQPQLFDLSQFLDYHDAIYRWLSKSAFSQPLVTPEVSQGSNSLANSALLFLAQQEKPAAAACGHTFRKPLSPVPPSEDAFDWHQTVLATLGLRERHLVTTPFQAPGLKLPFKHSTQKFMDAPPISVSTGHGTKDHHAKETCRRLPLPLSCLQAFGGFRSASNPFLYDNWTVPRPTIPLPLPLSVLHPPQKASPIDPFRMARMESHPFLHSDTASMGHSNGYCPLTASFTCPCLSKNWEPRGDGLPYLSGPAGNLNMRHDSGCTLRVEAMSTPNESTTSRSPDEVRAQQVDSVFANRNPWVNGRLRSHPPISSRYCLDYWTRVGSKYLQNDIHPAFITPNQELEPEEEWVSISREFDRPPNEDDIDGFVSVGSDEEYEMVQRNTTLYDLDGWECIGHSLIVEIVSCDFDEDDYDEFL